MDEQFDIILSIYNVEKLTTIRLEDYKYNNIWKGWLHYSRQHRPDFV